MAFELIEIKDFPKTTTLTGAGDEIFPVSKADGKTYGIKSSDFKAFLGTVQTIAPRPIKPTDPAPTLDGVYIPTVDGTYANAGGLTRLTGAGQVDDGMMVEFIKNGATWVKSTYPLPQAINEIPHWSGATLAGQQRLHNGQMWQAISNTSEGEEPGVSNKWTPEINLDGIINYVYGGRIDWRFDPALTEGFFIGRSGGLSPSTSDWWATVEFIPVWGASKLEYKGNFGLSGTSIAFYNMDRKFISSVPAANGTVTSISLDIPVNAFYVRVTCREAGLNNYSFKLIGMESRENIPKTFVPVGNSFIYENGVIKEANIIWNNGSTGRVVYDNWNEQEFAFSGFVATVTDRNLNVTQPPVTFNDSGLITNYPVLIYSQI